MGSHVSTLTTPAPPDAEVVATMDALRRLVRFLRLGTRAAQAKTGASSAQLFVLRKLEEQPASSIAELASRTHTDASSVSTVVARLVERGLVSRKTAPDDRRRASIALTARGRAALERAPEPAQERLLQALHDLESHERHALSQSLTAWVRAAGADTLEPRMFFEDESSGSSHGDS